VSLLFRHRADSSAAVHGAAHLFGKIPSPALAGTPTSIISEHTPLRVSPTSLGLPLGTKWVHAAAARGHILLVDSLGGVWGCGNNVMGQLGLGVCPEVEKFTRVTGPWMREKDASIVSVSRHRRPLRHAQELEWFADADAAGIRRTHVLVVPHEHWTGLCCWIERVGSAR
jgi:alpha-tubulin suppressor-like RCC1 family protein